SLCEANDLMLIAVSTTSDPTGTWYKYSFDVDDMPDYEKFGVWRDGYYMGTNNGSGKDIYVFERSEMLNGGASPQFVGFDNPWRPTTIDGFMCVPPLDNDGTYAPASSPGLFITINDDAIGGGSDQLWIYELSVDWSNTAASTFTRSQQINVDPFDSNFGNTWDNIAQPGTSQELDAIPQVVMNVPQYRNFGSYQTIVCCHAVDVDNTDHAGIRWYELRRTTGSWSVRQQGTYAPDGHSRWMGSIMLNGSDKIALGYSISSSTEYPGIRYCGQSAGAYASATGILDIPEEVMQAGIGSQTFYNRWGDYSLMCVDPVDDKTFWFTSEYIGSGGSRKTKIASFKFGNSPTVTTLPATSITSSSATLNGTVNSNGLATDYHFEWGTTLSYGNSTPVVAAGSGTSAVPVNASISSLTGGTLYHFRLVAVNADGTSYGKDETFTPGAATVTTTAASAITMNTASSGGTVTSDGGSAVTARGVCWGTSANPTIAGNYTTNGSGLGVFSSSLTGLSSNTTYHIRAWATNGLGTFYGNDLQFTTLCGIFLLPFTESFTGTTIPDCWSQVDHQGNGQVWEFGIITGQSPNPALTGNYAYLDSDTYGSGNSQNADLVTPTLDLSAFTSVDLQFEHYFKSYSGSSGTVSYSIDNGITWTSIETFTTTSPSNPTNFSQTIAGIAGEAQVKFKWNYNGSWGWYWGIDDIQVIGAGNNPTVITLNATTVNSSSATLNGTVNPNGLATDYHFEWGLTSGYGNSTPVIAAGSSTSPVNVNAGITGLTGGGTLYHFRLVAVNSDGTSYGKNKTFSTLCGAISNLPYSENFSSGLLPTCWGNIDHEGNGQVWQLNNPGGRTINTTTYSNGFAILDSDNYGWGNNQDADLVTPVFDFSNYSNVNLYFEHYFREYSGSSGTLSYSVDGGTSWTPVQSWITSTANAAVFDQDVTAEVAGKSNVKFKWHYIGSWGYYWAVDDFEVTGLSTNLNIQNVTVTSGQTLCNEAAQTLTVAGSGTSYTVENGGSAEFIAGSSVLFKAGVKVYPGGYLHGSISPGGPYCPKKPLNMFLTAQTLTKQDKVKDNFLDIYPNPNTGEFYIELSEDNNILPFEIAVYDFTGKLILVKKIHQNKTTVDLSAYHRGVYFIRADHSRSPKIYKLIKTDN
ncbi:T9SS type A sorting domain-containing protein, partial [bacterium]|nr:T9SS type A sorting domain-containing protein [bacterium]